MERLVLEGLVTTIGADGQVNVAPMGPLVDRQFRSVVLRPFQTSRTFENLRRGSPVIVHVTDNVELLAAAAIGAATDAFIGPTTLCPLTGGVILQNACRWYALQVTEFDAAAERATIACDVVAAGRNRDFFGLNRSLHAVVEAAILATRVDFLPISEIEADLQRLQPLVQKTGGAAEQRAFQQICDFVAAAQTKPGD
ncbi:DUF447 family protein [Blastopirellula sp. J2-11]|uniref:DUF447 domain-containing protein n=1 Tax=Blastopirellula sp. J2-11 TaxID=2943192 RepID=UPI0021C75B08|nr:DUF447 domain-containing protein [Blastopirellula sp. J2-11]UUO04418.1 DUF447 family protein [Blastopirellula sp. J2-11]